MGFLQRFLQYSSICIQCHNDPDADTIAAAFGLYRFFSDKGIDVSMVYGGSQCVKKSNLKMLIQECSIPLQHVQELPEHQLLMLADCQYRQGNVEYFPSRQVAIIDHHIRVVEDINDNFLVKSSYQSCSTIVWELLCQEGYCVREDKELSVALLYGLYTDTSGFADLFNPVDNSMRMELFDEQPLFDRLTKSNLSVAELLVASDAMYHHYFDVERRFAIVEALKCNQAVLGTIGDFMIQVDAVDLSFAYTKADAGYQISLRSCRENLPADRIAAYICQEIGSGGGHRKKAGGRILEEKLKERFGGKPIFDVVNGLLCQYFNEHTDC